MKYRKILIICLFLLEIISLSLTYKTYQNKVLKEENNQNIIEKKTFSMYIEKDGEYKEYNESNLFPSNLKYTFNINESYCVDIKDELVENVLTYQDGKVTITSNKTVFCYMYFDLDKVLPDIFTFYLGGSNNPDYVTNINTNAYLSWADEDITNYCLTIESNSTNCNWNEVTGTSIEVDYTLTSGLGTKTVYAYLKDMAGNISPNVSDAIGLYEEISIVPSQSGSLIYTGSSQTPSWNNYDSNKMTIGGTTSGTNAGSYNATFTPKTNYVWSDGTSTAKTVSWNIGKTSGSLSVSASTLDVNVGETGTITATRSGDGLVSATSSNTSVATVSVSGTTITVTGKGGGSATITINVDAGTNHTAPASKTINVTVTVPKITIKLLGEYNSESTFTANSTPNGYVVINGVEYTSAQTIEVDSGASVTIYEQGYDYTSTASGSGNELYLNGTLVQETSTKGTKIAYTFTATENILIDMNLNKNLKSGWTVAYIAKIGNTDITITVSGEVDARMYLNIYGVILYAGETIKIAKSLPITVNISSNDGYSSTAIINLNGTQVASGDFETLATYTFTPTNSTNITFSLDATYGKKRIANITN